MVGRLFAAILMWTAGLLVADSGHVAQAMPCIAIAGNPAIRSANQEFFVMEATHVVICDTSTAVIHVVGELTRDGVVAGSNSTTCVRRNSCGTETTATHTRHNHLHLWHGWTEGWHKHHAGDVKRKVDRRRSPDCTETNLIQVGRIAGVDGVIRAGSLSVDACQDVPQFR